MFRNPLQRVFAIVAVCLMAGLPWFAMADTQATNDYGLELSVGTDASSYQSNENIKIQVTVTNRNAFPVYDAALSFQLPQGYGIVEGTAAAEPTARLDVGETTSLSLLIRQSANTYPATGDSATPGIFLAALLLSAVLIAGLLLRRKTGRGKPRLFLCLLLALSFVLTPNVQTLAEGSAASMNAALVVSQGTAHAAANGSGLLLTGTASFRCGEHQSILTYDPNDGETPPFHRIAEQGKTAQKPENPIRNGYLFAGWYRDKACAQPYMFAEPVTGDITLYADWLSDADDSLLEDAYWALHVGYVSYNNSHCVTEDVALASYVTVDEERVPVVWHSAAREWISDTGAVTQPTGQSRDVTLTAVLTRDGHSIQKIFPVTVRRDMTLDPKSIRASDEAAIASLNKAEVTLDYKGDQLVSSDSMFSTIETQTPKDAIYAAYSARALLDMAGGDPFSELMPLVTNYDEYGMTFTLQQMYRGIPVYGRTITVSTDERYQTSGFTASYLGGIAVDITPAISVAQLRTRLANEQDACTVRSEELVVYTLDAYQDAPVLAYYTEYTTSAGIPMACVRDANTAAVIADFPLVYTETVPVTTAVQRSNLIASGRNELGVLQTFRVRRAYNTETGFSRYILRDIPLGIRMFDTTRATVIANNTNLWPDRTAVSAYASARQTYKWFLNTLNRDSLDSNGMGIAVVVHNNAYTDNAFWSSYDKAIYFCDNSGANPSDTTTAGSRDIFAHEYTHGVFYYVTNNATPYQGIPGAINEGYADLFGCFVDDDWRIGEDWKLLRSARNPNATGNPSKVGGTYYVNPSSNYDNGGVHANSTIVSHAAYLMWENGIPKSVLYKLWYRSMQLGYDGTSDWYSVRTNVLKAARQMGLNDETQTIIKQAFRDVGITVGAAPDLKIVLTWGASPADLDAHLVGPAADGKSDDFHVYWGVKSYAYNGVVYNELQVDDMNGDGPEVMLVNTVTDGVYRFSVHDFTNRNDAASQALSNAGATVQVYLGTAKTPVKTYTVPAGRVGNYWIVFDYNGATGVFQTVNILTNNSALQSPAE